MDQLLLDLMAFREQALRLILDLSSTVITLLVSSKLILLDKHVCIYIYIYIVFVVVTRTLVWVLIYCSKQGVKARS